MMYGFHGAITAATTAAHRRRQRMLEEQEETEMTKYSSDELDGNWEFKIVRSASAAFRKPEVLQQVLAEEAMAGWELLEKLDDSRLRLKRPRDARKRDDRLPSGIDPYRTYYGTAGENRMRIIVLLLVGLLVLGSVGGMLVLGSMDGGLVASFTEGTESGVDSSPPVVLITVFTTLILLVIAVSVKMRTVGMYSSQRSPAMVVAIILGVVLLAAGIVVFFLVGG